MGSGYVGRILHVDLDKRKTEVEEKEDAFYRTCLGGRGIGYPYLIKEVPPGIDPFSSRNVLVLATGVMTGAPLAASCRFSAIGKSPLTETAGESEAAGFFGPELKMAGFDAIVFRGKAESPVYLWVTDGKTGPPGGPRGRRCHPGRHGKPENPGGPDRGKLLELGLEWVDELL